PSLDPWQADAARRLVDAWPASTPGLHRLAVDASAVQLMLASGTPATWLREIVAQVDAFVVSSGAGDDDLLADQPRLAKSFARLAAPAATWVAQDSDAAGQEALRAAGFRFEPTPSAQPEALALARHLPHFISRGIDTRRSRNDAAEHRALIVGGGLAGCAAAWALAEHGWRSTVFERGAAIAGAASGNSAGLFHGIVNGHDGAHARFNRAAALEARSAVAMAIGDHGVAGGIDGLLQLVDTPHTVQTMAALLERLRLPAAYVRALDAGQASAIAGLTLQRPAWFYPGGGWVHPAGLARSFLERAGAAVDLRCSTAVAALRRAGPNWELLDSIGHVIDSAATVVLANGAEAPRLAGAQWPVESVRGQISMLSAARSTLLQAPKVPIAGSGYLLPEIGGQIIFGATAQPGDIDPAVRLDDHALNLAQLARLSPALGAAASIDPARLCGRTSWRCTSRDRLPLIGGVPLQFDDQAPHAGDAEPRSDQPRFMPRQSGLYVYAALGSRGIAWAALGAQVLASTIGGAPSPIEASLLDAVDPARFMVRESRRLSR
ncbi:MAG: FAD-dependent 5-carboxymethylaminomethyl-2-thiouridine(34) oxidoreductase MnmC, partial [Caldimonas sp.]